MRSNAFASMLVVLLGCSQTESLQDEDVVAVNDLILAVLPVPSVPSTLVVYECPDVLTGCSAAAFKSGNTCYPVTITPGQCVDTKIPVKPSSMLSYSSCTDANCSNCGQSATLTTPILTFESTWYSGASWYCRTQCTAPPTCQ
jgi:hypothetical protein